MLSREENDLICRVGPDTPMGGLMREYWIPALLSTELPEPDCEPVRVMLLGEPLVAFRDSDGKVGLMAHNCPHRGASLFFGRNEQGGIRCIYHGWKFDVTGKCLDMPNEPAESDFKNKVRARAYRCIERGGLVWTYMGLREEPPPLPGFEYLDAETAGPDKVTIHQVECNWLQSLEGDIDPTHVGFLHLGHVAGEEAPEGSFVRYMLEDRAPRIKLIDAAAGVTYASYRKAGNDESTYWRIGHFLLPFYTMPPIGVLGDTLGFSARVPMDDEHTLVVEAYTGGPTGGDIGLSGDRLEGLEMQPNTTDWYGRFRPGRSLANDYELDRAGRRRGETYSGFVGFATQDKAAIESMGPLVDRTGEHLGVADTVMIRARRRLLQAVKAYEEEGIAPPGVEEPAGYCQRPGGVVLPAGADWLEETRRLREGPERQQLDPRLTAGV